METPIIHYHNVILPVVSALDRRVLVELTEAITEIDYLVETIAYADLNPTEQEETELAYWAWWERIRNRICV